MYYSLGISNDPSFDLDPQLGKSINFDPFEELVKISKDVGVAKFFMHHLLAYMELNLKVMWMKIFFRTPYRLF